MTEGSSWRAAAQRAWNALPHQPAAAKRALALLATLHDLGWHRSAASGAPVSADGQPIPWYTYPAVLWLEPRLRSTDSIFEYGAGNSSLWYAARAGRVVSVEHNATWAATVQRRAPANATVLQRACRGDGTTAPPDDPYVTAISEFDGEPFDVVVVDGQSRVTCTEFVLPRLGASSLLILDNSDRPAYAPALAALSAAGMERIDFAGPVPGSGRLSWTSVFSQDLDRWLRPHPTLLRLGY